MTIANRIRATARVLVAAAATACAAAKPLPPASPAPLAEDYAVWGAALDAEIGTRADGARPVLLREMAAPFPPDTFYRRSVLGDLARAGIDERMAQAYVSRDSAPVRLDAVALGRRTRVRIAGVIGADVPDGPQAAPIVSVGRVAYDAHRRRALVNVWWTCGSLCGHGSLMLLEKDASGQWRQAAVVMSFRS